MCERAPRGRVRAPPPHPPMQRLRLTLGPAGGALGLEKQDAQLAVSFTFLGVTLYEPGTGGGALRGGCCAPSALRPCASLARGRTRHPSDPTMLCTHQ